MTAFVADMVVFVIYITPKKKIAFVPLMAVFVQIMTVFVSYVIILPPTFLYLELPKFIYSFPSSFV